MRHSVLLLAALSALACRSGDSSANRANAAAAPAPAPQAGQSVAPDLADAQIAAADQGRILGAASAPVWMLMVSDFQCPFCKAWHDSTFAAVKSEYVDKGKVRLAYLNFPLPQHANAWPAAIAAMCASQQGKFWGMHDRVFETQQRWEKLKDAQPFLDSLAVALGADAAKLHTCASDGKIRALIEADQARARRAGAEHTPTFFIGGVKVEGALPTAQFRKTIDSVLTASGQRN